MHYWQAVIRRYKVYVDTLIGVGCDSIVSTLDTGIFSTDLELCYGDSALFRRDV